jgi:hypothetical protein
MAVLLKGTTFSSGQSVDHTDMNNIIDTATLNPSESTGIIGSQTAEATIDGGDFVLVQDVSGTDILRKATVANIVGASGQVTATSLDSSEGTGGVIGGQTEEAAVASDDFVLIQDMSGTDILRKATVANLIGNSGIIQTAAGTAIGQSALAALTSGTGNVAAGYSALYTLATGDDNTAVGSNALKLATGDDNTAVGSDSLTANSSGDSNVAVGSKSLAANTTANQNTAVGHEALTTNETGDGSTAVGYRSLKVNTAGLNTAVGDYSLVGNTTGTRNVAVGASASAVIATKSDCTAVGYTAGAAATGKETTYVGSKAGAQDTMDDSTAVGALALNAVNTGAGNTACGHGALNANTSGAFGTAIGAGALQVNTSGTSNTAVGWAALYTNADGNTNTAVGLQALTLNTSGAQSTAVGALALAKQTTPGVNTGIGYAAGWNTTTSTDNTYVGNQAGQTNATGDDNTFVGDFAGYYVTAAQNTALGSGANTASGAPAAYTNTTCLGYAVNPTAANQVRLGNASVSSLHCQVALTVDSDERVKKNIKTSSLGLSFLNALRAVSFKKLNPFQWPEKLKEARFLRDGSDKPSDSKPKDDPNVYTGFIAQEVKKVLDDQGITEWDGWSEGENGMQSLTMTAFVPALIKAVQELSAKVEKLEAK